MDNSIRAWALEQLTATRESLRDTRARVDTLRGRENRWIVWARRDGASFTAIAHALGISKQAARTRYLELMAKGDPTGGHPPAEDPHDVVKP